MFAKVTVKYQHGKGSWKECTWVTNPDEATKLFEAQAIELIEQLRESPPGYSYTYQRDAQGEANRPPHGLNNFVVKRAQLERTAPARRKGPNSKPSIGSAGKRSRKRRPKNQSK